MTAVTARMGIQEILSSASVHTQLLYGPARVPLSALIRGYRTRCN